MLDSIDFSHHAYLIEGERADILPLVLEHLGARGVQTTGNPNLWQMEFDVFGIDESRALKSSHMVKGFVSPDSNSDERKFFLVCVNSFTMEAQHSLLKTFEEPVPNTHFLITMPDASALLPTLRSRLVIIERHFDSESTNSGTAAQKFLASPSNERMTQIKNMIENKDKNAVASFIDALERTVYAQLQKDGLKSGRSSRALLEIERSRSYVRDTASSIKMILEHLALALPRIE